MCFSELLGWQYGQLSCFASYLWCTCESRDLAMFHRWWDKKKKKISITSKSSLMFNQTLVLTRAVTSVWFSVIPRKKARYFIQCLDRKKNQLKIQWFVLRLFLLQQGSLWIFLWHTLNSMIDCFQCVTENMYSKRKPWIKGAKYMFSDEMLNALGLFLKPQNATADVFSRFTPIVEWDNKFHSVTTKLDIQKWKQSSWNKHRETVICFFI